MRSTTRARSVSSAGDVNGDGFDDLIVGAPYADASGNFKSDAGESYVIFGGDFLGGVVFAGTAGADTLTGTAAAETFVGGQGNDTLIGNGGADAFQGGAGDDTIVVGSALPLDLNGGSGVDTVTIDALGNVDRPFRPHQQLFHQHREDRSCGYHRQHAGARQAGRARRWRARTAMHSTTTPC